MFKSVAFCRARKSHPDPHNTSTKVYHKDGAFHGKTKKGRFMTEDDAKKAGYNAAKVPATKKAKADAKK